MTKDRITASIEQHVTGVVERDKEFKKRAREQYALALCANYDCPDPTQKGQTSRILCRADVMLGRGKPRFRIRLCTKCFNQFNTPMKEAK